eukprot:127623-Pelagomonas_calceolata.AAC.2
MHTVEHVCMLSLHMCFGAWQSRTCEYTTASQHDSAASDGGAQALHVIGILIQFMLGQLEGAQSFNRSPRIGGNTLIGTCTSCMNYSMQWRRLSRAKDRQKHGATGVKRGVKQQSARKRHASTHHDSGLPVE